MKNLNLREKIKKILKALYGEPPYRIVEATDQILQAFKEILPDKKDIFGTTIDIIRSPIMIVSPKYKKG